MKISDRAQELLESMWNITQEGMSEMENDPADIAELVRLGFVTIEKDQPELTPQGQQEAALAIRRHRLAERLLSDVLITEEAALDERACGLEPALFDGIDESICTLLGHPQFCPHGKPIPPGVCCRQARTSLAPLIAPMKELKRGQRGRIAYLHLQRPAHLNKLMAMGVLPGAEIRMKETYPAFVFEAGYSQFAVDEQIAGDIFVRLAPD